MDGDKTIAANFMADPVCYTLVTSTDPAGSGSISADPAPNCGGKYMAGTAVQLTATAHAGSDFAYWSGDASGSVAMTSVTMDRDKMVTAHFIQFTPTPTPTAT